ncbi:unnamed protein product [Moneuplotes crassus]|uniref:DAGKc domain-containing protein n=1 Tax=Euplotes crassus TaxID=5936 RepID=A0AAD1XBX6_EUPCR|nr:unnamed protein product [Moneuplotes crassus]
MGNSNPRRTNCLKHDRMKLATVRKTNSPNSEVFDLFVSYEKDKTCNELGLDFKEIFTLPKNMRHQNTTFAGAGIQIECDFLINFESFLTVTREIPEFDSLAEITRSLDQDDIFPDTPQELKLVLIHSNLKQEVLYFDVIEELIRTETVLTSLNKFKDRHLAVLVNPISGKQRGRRYYRDILAPTLNITGIKHDHFETDSETYIETWVDQFSNKPFPYTDIILIGGDGLFSQLINSILNNPDCQDIIKTPIGLLPAGSQNATCCDLKGKDVYQACRNIVRRPTVQSDIMKIQFSDMDSPLYATVILWGVLGDVVKNAEKLRKYFKSARYTVSAAKMMLSSCRMKTYKCSIKFRSDFITAEDSGENLPKVEETKENDVIEGTSFTQNESNKIEEKSWNEHPDSDLSFLGLVTHECRSSLSKKERFMPPSRFNDGRISLATLRKCGKIKLIHFMKKFSKAKHLDFEKFNGIEVSEVQISPGTRSWFNIDGEIYENDEANIKLLPSFLTMIGNVYDK